MAKTARSRTEFVSVDVTSGKRTLYTASNQTKLSPKFLSGGRIGYAVRSATAAEEGIKIWNPDLRVVDVVKGAVRGPAGPPMAHTWFDALRKAMTEHFIPTEASIQNSSSTSANPLPRSRPTAHSCSTVSIRTAG